MSRTRLEPSWSSSSCFTGPHPKQAATKPLKNKAAAKIRKKRRNFMGDRVGNEVFKSASAFKGFQGVKDPVFSRILTRFSAKVKQGAKGKPGKFQEIKEKARAGRIKTPDRAFPVAGSALFSGLRLTKPPRAYS
ncbi:MAG: hypothetical protein K6C40_10530 [Thermoguttaceae bacterium]|nr:hypothetical protein [Thermoguttaceae bacterium]